MLYAHIVDGVLVDVGELPESARRLDTGEIINDLPGTGIRWARACGYFDVDEPGQTFDGANLTDAQRAAVTAAVTAEVTASESRRDYVDGVAAQWATARDYNRSWLAATPPTATAAQITYLYQHERRLTDQVLAIGNLVVLMARVVAEAIDRASDVEPPT